MPGFTTYRTWTDGELVNKAIMDAQVRDNGNFIRPLTARLAADFSVASNTSLQNVTGMSFPIGASETWAVQLRAGVTIPSTPDAKFHWSTPAGATGNHTALSLSTGGSAVIANDVVVAGSGGLEVFHFDATIINSTTAGTVQFQMAQNTSDAGAVVMNLNAVLIANRLA